MKLSIQDLVDLVTAILEAQDELCFDPNDGSKFPEAYNYNERLEVLKRKLRSQIEERGNELR